MLRKILLAILICSVATYAGILATDNFNRADGGLGVNWTTLIAVNVQAPSIISNQIVGNDTGHQVAAYTAIVFPSDQSSQVTYTGTTGSDLGAADGAMIRLDAANGNGYGCQWYNGNVNILEFSSGVLSVLASAVSSLANGDLLKGSAVGTTLTCYVNGVSKATITNADFASGQPGIYVYGNVPTFGAIDDWQGGDFAAGTGTKNSGPTKISGPTKSN